MARKCTEEQCKLTADKVRKLTEELKIKMEELFESEMYKKYLSFMGKFHQYSWNNSLLILIQMPTAELVAGYSSWKKMGRYVKAGQKGITIFAPAPHKKSVEKTDRDGQPVIGRDGHTETEEILIPGYKTATVFDLSQTDGKALPTLRCKELTGSVEYYEDMIEAIYSISPCPITEEEIRGGAKGFQNEQEEHPVKTGTYTYVTKRGCEAIADCFETYSEILDMLDTSQSEVTPSSSAQSARWGYQIPLSRGHNLI